jgi:hypothetical protein
MYLVRLLLLGGVRKGTVLEWELKVHTLLGLGTVRRCYQIGLAIGCCRTLEQLRELDNHW